MGRKRKTRWRRLSIGETSGNEEEELCDGVETLHLSVKCPAGGDHHHHHHPHHHHHHDYYGEDDPSSTCDSCSKLLNGKMSNGTISSSSGAVPLDPSNPEAATSPNNMTQTASTSSNSSVNSGPPSSSHYQNHSSASSSTSSHYNNSRGYHASYNPHHNHHHHPNSHHHHNNQNPHYHSSSNHHHHHNSSSYSGKGEPGSNNYHNGHYSNYYDGGRGRNNYNNYRNHHHHNHHYSNGGSGAPAGVTANGTNGGNSSGTDEAGSNNPAAGATPTNSSPGGERGGAGATNGANSNYHHHHPSSRGGYSGRGGFRRPRGYGSYYYSNNGSTGKGAEGPNNRPSYNQDEYTKITTPRQDVLFKKGYLSQKKSTSVESNSATTTPSASTNGTPDTQSTNGVHSDYSEGYENGETDGGVHYDDTVYYGAPPDAVFTDPHTGQVFYGHCSPAGEYFDAYPVMVAGYPAPVYYHMPYPPMDWNGMPTGPIYSVMAPPPIPMDDPAVPQPNYKGTEGGEISGSSGADGGTTAAATTEGKDNNNASEGKSEDVQDGETTATTRKDKKTDSTGNNESEEVSQAGDGAPAEDNTTAVTAQPQEGSGAAAAAPSVPAQPMVPAPNGIPSQPPPPPPMIHGPPPPHGGHGHPHHPPPPPHHHGPPPPHFMAGPPPSNHPAGNHHPHHPHHHSGMPGPPPPPHAMPPHHMNPVPGPFIYPHPHGGYVYGPPIYHGYMVPYGGGPVPEFSSSSSRKKRKKRRRKKDGQLTDEGSETASIYSAAEDDPVMIAEEDYASIPPIIDDNTAEEMMEESVPFSSDPPEQEEQPFDNFTTTSTTTVNNSSCTDDIEDSGENSDETLFAHKFTLPTLVQSHPSESLSSSNNVETTAVTTAAQTEEDLSTPEVEESQVMADQTEVKVTTSTEESENDEETLSLRRSVKKPADLDCSSFQSDLPDPQLLHLQQSPEGNEPSSPDSFNTTQSMAGSEAAPGDTLSFSETDQLNRTTSVDEVEEDLPQETCYGYEGNSMSSSITVTTTALPNSSSSVQLASVESTATANEVNASACEEGQRSSDEVERVILVKATEEERKSVRDQIIEPQVVPPLATTTTAVKVAQEKVPEMKMTYSEVAAVAALSSAATVSMEPAKKVVHDDEPASGVALAAAEFARGDRERGVRMNEKTVEVKPTPEWRMENRAGGNKRSPVQYNTKDSNNKSGARKGKDRKSKGAKEFKDNNTSSSSRKTAGGGSGSPRKSTPAVTPEPDENSAQVISPPPTAPTEASVQAEGEEVPVESISVVQDPEKVDSTVTLEDSVQVAESSAATIGETCEQPEFVTNGHTPEPKEEASAAAETALMESLMTTESIANEKDTDADAEKEPELMASTTSDKNPSVTIAAASNNSSAKSKKKNRKSPLRLIEPLIESPEGSSTLALKKAADQVELFKPAAFGDRPQSITLAVSEWLKAQGDDVLLTPLITTSTTSSDDYELTQEDEADDEDTDDGSGSSRKASVQEIMRQNQKNVYGNPWVVPSNKSGTGKKGRLFLTSRRVFRVSGFKGYRALQAVKRSNNIAEKNKSQEELLTVAPNQSTTTAACPTDGISSRVAPSSSSSSTPEPPRTACDNISANNNLHDNDDDDDALDDSKISSDKSEESQHLNYDSGLELSSPESGDPKTPPEFPPTQEKTTTMMMITAATVGHGLLAASEETTTATATAPASALQSFTATSAAKPELESITSSSVVMIHDEDDDNSNVICNPLNFSKYYQLGIVCDDDNESAASSIHDANANNMTGPTEARPTDVDPISVDLDEYPMTVSVSSDELAIESSLTSPTYYSSLKVVSFLNPPQSHQHGDDNEKETDDDGNKCINYNGDGQSKIPSDLLPSTTMSATTATTTQACEMINSHVIQMRKKSLSYCDDAGRNDDNVIVIDDKLEIIGASSGSVTTSAPPPQPPPVLLDSNEPDTVPSPNIKPVTTSENFACIDLDEDEPPSLHTEQADSVMSRCNNPETTAENLSTEEQVSTSTATVASQHDDEDVESAKEEDRLYEDVDDYDDDEEIPVYESPNMDDFLPEGHPRRSSNKSVKSRLEKTVVATGGAATGGQKIPCAICCVVQ